MAGNLPWRESAGGSTPPSDSYLNWRNLDADDNPSASLESRLDVIDASIDSLVPSSLPYLSVWGLANGSTVNSFVGMTWMDNVEPYLNPPSQRPEWIDIVTAVDTIDDLVFLSPGVYQFTVSAACGGVTNASAVELRMKNREGKYGSAKFERAASSSEMATQFVLTIVCRESSSATLQQVETDYAPALVECVVDQPVRTEVKVTGTGGIAGWFIVGSVVKLV